MGPCLSALPCFKTSGSVGGTKTGSRGALFSFSGGGGEKRRENDKAENDKVENGKVENGKVENDRVHRSETRERVFSTFLHPRSDISRQLIQV